MMSAAKLIGVKNYTVMQVLAKVNFVKYVITRESMIWRLLNILVACMSAIEFPRTAPFKYFQHIGRL
jgi:hypothetical protein